MTDHPMQVNTNTRVRWESIRRFPELHSLSGKAVLDVGAGLGFFSTKFRERGGDVLAVDIDRAALEYLHNRYGIKTERVDVLTEALPEGRFDLVFIGEVLEHVADPLDLIQKAQRAIRDGGYLLITSPALEGILIHSRGKSLCHDSGPEKHEKDGYLSSELRKMLKTAGLYVIRHDYCVDLLAELFMQATKVGYSLKSSGYKSQADVIRKTGGLPYRLMRMVYPLIFAFLRLEYGLCRRFGFRGHCHVFLARKAARP